jgi:predicted NAD/FAD-binding protein
MIPERSDVIGGDAMSGVAVTLNQEVAKEHVLRRFTYHHPIFTPESIIAQQNHRLINGTSRTYYCGAYWRNGFHEDGVVSTVNALSHFKQDISNEQKLSLRWAS